MSEQSIVERELAVRLAAMDWLSTFPVDQTFRYETLADFHFGALRVPLMDWGRGIRKPAGMRAALSFRTVYTPPSQVPPYGDDVGPDGLLRYKLRGDSRGSSENESLREAMQQGLPLIWFVGVSSGIYLPRYPVHLMAEEPNQFVVALDQAQRRMSLAGAALTDPDDRRYAEAITERRLHQPLFRARVIEAYDRRCAMCQLRHASLLDASHILSDRHEMGQPVVPNGLALCKIHHAAFDQNILGISPDLRISVRDDVLVELDGPMLKHGIQALEGQRLRVPSQRAAAPDRGRLEIRYREFREAA